MIIDLTDGSDNLPGMQSLFFTNVNNVVVIPEPVGMVITTAITLKDPDLLHEIKCSLGSFKFLETEIPVNGDSVYASTFTGFLPKDNPMALSIFNGMRGQRYIVKGTDNNDLLRLMGIIEEPCEFSILERGSGETPSDNNGYQLQFKTTRRVAVPFIQS